MRDLVKAILNGKPLDRVEFNVNPYRLSNKKFKGACKRRKRK